VTVEIFDSSVGCAAELWSNLLQSELRANCRLLAELGSDFSVADSKPGGGTYNVNIQACLTKLADAVGNGGAATAFSSTNAGSAVVSISRANHQDILEFVFEFST
jgi:hypothetical protein